MLEEAFTGSRRYWGWVLALVAVIGIAGLFYSRQLQFGLGITGLSRDVTWGLYIAQFTFLVGVAASAVMVVLPYYLHDWKAFGKITILGEFLAVSAVAMCMLFILVDMGQPMRVLNVILHPTPSSLMFWDMLSLGGYLVLNAVISLTTLSSERKSTPPPRWLRPVVLLSIPWAVSIHTVTAFLYSGLPGRSFWLTALLAPRFLASAFAAGPALLVLLAFALRGLAGFDAGRQAIRGLSLIVTYAMAASVFFVLVELFTVFYSQIPEHVEHFAFLFVGRGGQAPLAVWMWTSAALAVAALTLLLVPRFRQDERLLAMACAMVFVSLWIEKGLGLILGGFLPSPLGHLAAYVPTLPEVSITVGVWAAGALVVTMLTKIMLAVRQ
jgi:molybdopterin-containing oxidoreductase family membrane subunit